VHPATYGEGWTTGSVIEMLLDTFCFKKSGFTMDLPWIYMDLLHRVANWDT
jgi:hypothetical protein